MNVNEVDEKKVEEQFNAAVDDFIASMMNKDHKLHIRNIGTYLLVEAVVKEIELRNSLKS